MSVSDPSGHLRPTHEAARLELARVAVDAPGKLADALQRVAAIAAGALRVERVSLWRLFDAGRLLRCDLVLEPARQTVFAGTVLRAADFPMYLEALRTRRVVPVSNVDGDGITEEFRAPYLTPLGITAMLDAPIYQRGDVVGIICHEQLGGSRQWSAEDCECASAVADAVARVYEEARGLEAEDVAERYHERLVRLRHLAGVGRLAAGMAHDVGNILHTVAGNAHLLEEIVAPGSEAAELVRRLLVATDRGVLLTRQLAHLGRADVRKPKVVDLRDAVDQALDLLRLAAGARCEVVTDHAGAVSRVFVDPVEIERALLNLVTNAREAMPDGGVITIAVRETSRTGADGADRSYVLLEVGDTGGGMDAATQQRAFEPFFTTRAGGTGLGLSIVQHIAELSGGVAELETSAGGTIVRLALPSIAPPAGAAPAG